MTVSTRETVGMTPTDSALEQLRTIWSALGGAPEALQGAEFTDERSAPSRFPVTSFAAASIAAAGCAIAELLAAGGARPGSIRVNRALATAWFGRPNQPIGGWEHAEGNGVTGEYLTGDDRWIRLQMNYPRHYAAVLTALDCPPERSAIAAALRSRSAEEADRLLTEAGGAVAIARTREEWAAHPQFLATKDEPLVDAVFDRGARDSGWRPTPGRPLAGIRVLDMTRVLAGPMSTRFLASYGAEVLRIDPPGYLEPRGPILVTLGKRCARLDASTPDGRATLLELLAGADVMVHGYRDGVLDGLGLDAGVRAEVRPGLVEVALTAYGWSGPWHDRRGFDTLVEMVTGMAIDNEEWAHAEQPQLLPVQALDHGTGHLMAAAAIRGLTRRLETGEGSRWRCALTRTAAHLMSVAGEDPAPPIDPATLPYGSAVITTPRGPAHRLEPAVVIEGSPQFWERPGEAFGSSSPVWASEGRLA